MLTFLVRRVALAIPVLFGILLIAFIFVHMLPGDPAQMMMSPDQLAGPDSAQYLARRRAELGLDQPLPVQFLAWARDVFQGNLGYSYHQRVPVTELIGQRVGATFLLTGAGVALALVIGVPTGVFAALRQNSWFDYTAAAGSMLAISIPVFFLGMAGIYVFAIWLGILPSGGMNSLGQQGSFVDTLEHLILPAGVLSAVLVGPYVRYTRASMLEVMRQDFITTANAKGVPRRGVVVAHGLRNALVPLITVLAVQVPALLAGAVVTETIFSWPGLGRLVLEAINSRDYPVILAIVMMSAVLVMLFTLIADVVTALLDPRIRL